MKIRPKYWGTKKYKTKIKLEKYFQTDHCIQYHPLGYREVSQTALQTQNFDCHPLLEKKLGIH